jgi:hypothetical protein
MAWYRAGTVTVTNGSAAVTGAGTNFVANVGIGEAFLGPDGRVYEIGEVISATSLNLTGPYLGGSGGGQGYAILPTQSFARDLAVGAAELLNTFGAVRDGIGQGLIGDGTVAAPALRFSADQDTGIYRSAANSLTIATGGAERFAATASNLLAYMPFIAAVGGGAGLHAFRNDPATSNLRLTSSFPGGSTIDFNSGVNGVSNDGLDVRLNGVSRLVIDAAGNLLAGASSGSSHVVNKTVALNAGAPVLDITATGVGYAVARFSGVSGSPASPAACAFRLGTDATTGRSINAGGTINASGADYAEYMTKADGCGVIAPGDVCGVDADGKLTRTWADAISFVVKSTDPAYVGGDRWASHMAPRPEEPGPEPVAPAEPGPMPEGVEPDSPELDAWRASIAAYPGQLTGYQTERAAWEAAIAAHAQALAAWGGELETCRQCVDRIAFCGQVPVNVSGDFAPGDYVIAAANGGGIKAIAVPAADIIFDDYRRRIGKVWAVRDGRAWVDVQHG